MDHKVSHTNTKHSAMTEVQPVKFKTERCDHDTDSVSSGELESQTNIDPQNSPGD